MRHVFKRAYAFRAMKLLIVGDFQGVVPAKLKKRLMREKFDAVVGVGDYAGLREWRPFIMHNLRAAKEGLPLFTRAAFFGKKKLKVLVKQEEQAARDVLRFLDSLGKPVIFVFGNSDDDWYRYGFDRLWEVSKKKQRFLRSLKNMKDVTYGKKKFAGITYVGFGGYMDIDAYFERGQWKQDDAQARRRRLLRRVKSRKKFFSALQSTKAPRIFVLHYPPQGAFDIIHDREDNPMNGKSAGIGFFTQAIRKYKPVLVLCGHMHEYQGMKKLHGIPVVNPGDAEKGKYAVVEILENNAKKVRARFRR